MLLITMLKWPWLSGVRLHRYSKAPGLIPLTSRQPTFYEFLPIIYLNKLTLINVSYGVSRDEFGFRNQKAVRILVDYGGPQLSSYDQPGVLLMYVAHDYLKIFFHLIVCIKISGKIYVVIYHRYYYIQVIKNKSIDGRTRTE